MYSLFGLYNDLVYNRCVLFLSVLTPDVAAEDFDGIDLYCKVSSELLHSVHLLLISVKFQLI